MMMKAVVSGWQEVGNGCKNDGFKRNMILSHLWAGGYGYAWCWNVQLHWSQEVGVGFKQLCAGILVVHFSFSYAIKSSFAILVYYCLKLQLKSVLQSMLLFLATMLQHVYHYWRQLQSFRFNSLLCSGSIWLQQSYERTFWNFQPSPSVRTDWIFAIHPTCRLVESQYAPAQYNTVIQYSVKYNTAVVRISNGQRYPTRTAILP